MSKIISVSSLPELYAALAIATNGETILLDSGNYGDLFLGGSSKFDITFPSGVTIASADPENPATFSGLDLRGASNLTFDSIAFDYEFQAGDAIWARPFSMVRASNITIQNSIFDGDVAHNVSETADGYGYAIGFSAKWSTGITLENNEIFDFFRGMTISYTSDVTLRGNDIHSLRMDGMNFAAVSNAVIENNYIHDFRGSPNSDDHSDMIQFHTTGTNIPNTDITIRDNYLDIGEGTPTQSIFMRNEMVDKGFAGTEMYYRDIVIENNVIVNGHAHGITVGEADELTISNNSVLHADGANSGSGLSVEIPKINVAKQSTNVEIIQNATAAINGQTDQPDWTVRDNAIVQDTNPNAPGYYEDIFLSTSLDPSDGVHNFQALPGGILDKLSAGASYTVGELEAEDLTVHFQVTKDDDNPAMRHFDASFSLDGQNPLPETTKYIWNFADGSTATGMQVSHIFSKGNTYDVTLTIQLPDGQSQSRLLSVDVAGSSVLSYTAQDGMIVFENGSPSPEDIQGAVTAEGIQLGGQGSVAQVAREYVTAVLDTNEFSLSMALTSGSLQSAGEVMRLHASFVVYVTSEGELYLRTYGTDGTQTHLETSGANLTDMNLHNVNISLKDGALAISVDGNTLAATEVTSPLADNGNHSLTFGNPWNETNFDGVLSSLDISVNESHYFDQSDKNSLTSSNPEDSGQLPEAPDLNSYVLSYTAQDGLVTFENGDAAATDIIGVTTSKGIYLGGQGSIASIARAQVTDILEQDSFSISMTLTSNGLKSAGEIMRLHSSFIASVTSKGELNLYLCGEDGGRWSITTQGANLSDMEPHDISVSYSNGSLEVAVNGNVLASAEGIEPLADVGQHDLTFGNPWNGTNFDGVLSQLAISLSDEPIDSQATVPDYDLQDPTPLPENPSTDTAPELSAVFSYTAENGLITFENGDVAATGITGTTTSEGIYLGGQGSVANIARTHVTDILEQDSFSISMTLTSSGPQSAGEIMRLHSSFTASVTSTGELNLYLCGEDGGRRSITTQGANLSDMAPHDINISYASGSLKIIVNGNLLASAKGVEPLADVGQHNLTFGNPWNGTNFDGVLSQLAISLSDEPLDSQATVPDVQMVTLELPFEQDDDPWTSPLAETSTEIANPFETMLTTGQDDYFI